MNKVKLKFMCITVYVLMHCVVCAGSLSINNNIHKNLLASDTVVKQKSKTHASKKNYMLGIASYYGGQDGFDGRKMADGQIFDSNNPRIAAHPTLPLGTKLKIINQRNGRFVYVEIKDRMPLGNRIVDVSKAAAIKLGMYHCGVTRVKLIRISNAEFKKYYYNLKHKIKTPIKA